MDTFHRFGELPFELREKIWQLAVRPARRGVHWFALQPDEGDEPLNVPEDTVMEPLRPWAHMRLVAPTREQTSLAPCATTGLETVDNTASQAHHNPSTYNIDGGLWTACKESRRVMEHHFRDLNHRYATLPRYHNDPDIGKRSWTQTAAVTSYFARKNHVPHHFTVVPHADLFCLPLETIHKLNWDSFPMDLGFGSLYESVHSIAFIYQPEWGENENGKGRCSSPMFNALADVAFDSGVEYIWLIDTELKRRSQQQPLDQHTQARPEVFLAAGRRFEAVGDGENWEWPEGTEGNQANVTSIEFARRLDDESLWRYDADWDYEPEGRVVGARFGVLACEYL